MTVENTMAPEEEAAWARDLPADCIKFADPGLDIARIVQLRMAGCSLAQLSELMGLSPSTIANRMASLALPHTGQVQTSLVAYAIDNDLIPEASEIGQALLRLGQASAGRCGMSNLYGDSADVTTDPVTGVGPAVRMTQEFVRHALRKHTYIRAEEEVIVSASGEMPVAVMVAGLLGIFDHTTRRKCKGRDGSMGCQVIIAFGPVHGRQS